ncbi:polysaccharide biosynthesis/export family protein [Geotoga petraea]|uniref:Protein involved in polysaccharide export, contains SLBB domain of the beta-grasp fold n=1 Tax=Geotoga petraea TaxID=28234 RepID=A0A1G6KPL5_9BACT|nr:polysaccharide biosynthesis/export family protein [Geotoga petraea]MDK2946676.1 polysaccharide biosynthesis/export protein [Geotoga sp.]SDC32837.1 protein involved in polysaccharide export, contains SLBB domain of the beta-grasp fold [Geotoga petraea]
MKKFGVLLLLIVPLLVFSYSVRIGDSIGVWVFGYEEYSASNLVVGPSGEITLPPIGRIEVEGKTIDEIEDILSEKMSEFVKNTRITAGVTNYAPFKVNVLGNVPRNGMLDIKKEQIKLSELISMVGGINNPEKTDQAIIRDFNGNEKIVDISWLLKGERGEDPFIEENSMVIFPVNYDKKVNLFSEFGTQSIDYYDGLTLKTVLSNINIPIDNVDDNLVLIRDSNYLNYSIDKIIKEKDVDLKSGDTIILKRIEKYAYALLKEKTIKVTFEKDEAMNVKNLIAKVQMNPQYIEKVTKDNKDLNLETEIKTGDFINIIPVENQIYLSGSFVNTGKIAFDVNTEITIPKILSVAKGFTPEYSGKLIEITKMGKTKVYDINPMNISEYTDIKVNSESTLIAESEERLAYIMGEISTLETYTLNDTLYDLLFKYDLSESYEIKYKTETTEGTLKGSDIEKQKAVELSGKVMISINKTKTDSVIYYKSGDSGAITKKEVTLMDIFQATGGFAPSSQGTIKVFKNNQLISEYTEDDVKNNPLTKVEKGSYVVVQPNLDYSYIVLMGSVQPKNIRSDIPVSLVEILAGSGFNWDYQESVWIYTANDEKVEVEIQDIEQIRNTMVAPGSIVYVPTIQDQLIYVLGNVSRPGPVAYTKEITLLDAVLKSGNATKAGDLKNVYLFKDGVENPPVSLDISGIIKANPIQSPMNPKLKPGDIIYIPQNGLASITEIMSTVSTFMGFINSSVDTYQNINSLF